MTVSLQAVTSKNWRAVARLAIPCAFELPILMGLSTNEFWYNWMCHKSTFLEGEKKR
jgi:hypothetical protein